MDRNDILNAIKDLSCSQGFYGRLLARILEVKEYDPDAYENLMEELEAQNFSDPVDMVLYFEC